MRFLLSHKTRSYYDIRINVNSLFKQVFNVFWAMLSVSIKLDGVIIAIPERILHTGLKSNGKTAINGKVNHVEPMLPAKRGCRITRAVINNHVIRIR